MNLNWPFFVQDFSVKAVDGSHISCYGSEEVEMHDAQQTSIFSLCLARASRMTSVDLLVPNLDDNTIVIFSADHGDIDPRSWLTHHGPQTRCHLSEDEVGDIAVDCSPSWRSTRMPSHDEI